MSESPAVPTSFWATLHSVNGGRGWPPTDAADVERFVEAVERNRLLMIAAADAALGPLVGSLLEDRKRALEVEIEARAVEQSRTRERLVAVLHPGSYIGVKGIDYRDRLYGDSRLRPMDDVDFLVRDRRFAAQVAAAEGAGFEIRLRRPGLEVKFEDPRNGVAVDFYRVFIQRQRVDIDYASIWRRATSSGDAMLVMCMPHALAIQALSMANEQYVSHMRKYLDLWLLSRDESVVSEAQQIARAWNMRRAFYASMTMLASVVPEVSEEPWYPSLEGLLTAGERRWMHRGVLPAGPVPQSPRLPLRLWRKFSLIDRWRQRIRFVTAHGALRWRGAVVGLARRVFGCA